MGSLLKGSSQTRIEAVNSAFRATVKRMLRLSTKGDLISPRYNISLIAYSTKPVSILPGIKTLAEVIETVPRLEPTELTDTAAAFSEVEKLLDDELPKLTDCPAPLVCHMTDGEYNGPDPEPIAQRIMQMGNKDGHVLLENIYVKDNLMGMPIGDVHGWPGVTMESELSDDYAKKLFRMTSVIPETYRQRILEEGYRLQEGTKLFFPGETSDLLELGFVISAVTQAT